MDGHRHVDAVNDSSLDREIESLLAVEPSPEFLARVRARVARGTGAGRMACVVDVRGRRLRWPLVIVAVIAWPSREPAPSSGAPVRSSAVSRRASRRSRRQLVGRRRSGQRDDGASRGGCCVVRSRDRIDLPES